MRIALATCAELPPHEKDDRFLHDALDEREVEWASVAWDDTKVDWGAFDACLIRTTWDYMDRRDEFVAWTESVAAVTRIYNPPELVRWNTHKSYLYDLEARGAPLAPTVFLKRGSTGELSALLCDWEWSRAMLKPAVGATARETIRFETDSAGIASAQEHLARLLPLEDMLLQRYCESVESEGELSAIFVDGELTHAVRKIPNPGDFRVQDDFGARDEPYRFDPAELSLAKDIVAAIEGDCLYARVDFLRGDDGGLLLNELELVEPSMFFRHSPEAAGRLADAVSRRILAS